MTGSEFHLFLKRAGPNSSPFMALMLDSAVDRRITTGEECHA